MPAKPLDKSTPQAPEDENGVVTAENGDANVEDDTNGVASTDEEAGGAHVEDDSDSASSNASGDDNGDKHARERKGSWWNWLFNGDAEAQRPPKPVRSSTPDDSDSGDGAAPSSRAVVTTNAPPPHPPSPPAESRRPLPRIDTGDEDSAPAVEQDTANGVHIDRPRRAPILVQHDTRPPPPPRTGPPPPPPPDVDDGAQHPDGGDSDDDNQE